MVPPETREPAALQTSRYTPDGDDAVESRISHDQQLIAAAVTDLVPAAHFRALVLKHILFVLHMAKMDH